MLFSLIVRIGERYKKKKYLAILIVLVIFLVAANCSAGQQWVLFHDKEIKGSVVDVETGKHIEGTIIIGMWALTQIPGEGFGGYAKIQVTSTNNEGNFTIPAWTTFKPWKLLSVTQGLAPKIIIYKPGYKLYWSHKKEREGYKEYYQLYAPVEMEKIKEAASFTPAKLKRIYTDEEIWKSYLDFRSEVDLYIKTYSTSQFKEIYSLIRNGVHQLPETNKESRKKILNHIQQFDK
jgi:hypothetical protein